MAAKTEKSKKIISKSVSFFVVILLSAMVAMTFINATLRYTIGSNIMSFEEYSRFAFVWIFYVGSIIAFKKKRHVAVTVISDLFKGKVKNFVELMCELITLTVMGIVFYSGVIYTMQAITYKTAATDTNFAVLTIGLPIMAISMIGIQLWDMYKKYINKG